MKPREEKEARMQTSRADCYYAWSEDMPLWRCCIGVPGCHACSRDV
jgi:hypothetical protein